MTATQKTVIFSEETLNNLLEDPIAILNRGYRAKERIAARQERIRSWRQIAESITANPENTPSGNGPSNKVEKAVLSIITLEEEITDEIAEIAGYEVENGRILRFFVVEPNYRAVLEHRYLEYKPWEAIAVEMGYTFRWTQELHRRAVQVLRDSVADYLGEKKAR